MYLIGDIHGKFTRYSKIINKLPYSIQLGDMGIGFGRDNRFPITDKHFFIRGNHDNPAICKKMKNYLGDYGNLSSECYFLSGGYSVDKNTRTPEVNWWQEEELETAQFNKAYNEYIELKPKFMLTHECPASVLDIILRNKKNVISSTSRALEMMLEVHKPDIWVFAHHHYDSEFIHNDVHFVCVGECNVYDLERKKFV